MQPITLPSAASSLSFSAIDPLDGRYYDTESATYLSEASRIAYQAYVEAALAQTLAEHTICSQAVADEIEAAARSIDPKSVYEEEKITKHDIKAVVNTIKKDISGTAQPFVHFGATSYDIVATAQALQLRDVTKQVVVPRLKDLLRVLCDMSKQYQDTLQIGRTHGQHGVPVTFGFAIAEYVSRLGSSTKAIEALTGELVGKFSGAVGAYNALSIFAEDPLQFEKSVLAKVDLRPAEYSNQIVPPEAVIRLIDELTIAAGIMANVSHDMRHLQRTEIAEVQEKFEKGQTGSSTMAHKRNPWNFENVISMHKEILGQAVTANLNIASEHQRDLTDSAASRFYTIVFAGVASMTQRLTRIMSKLEVNEAAMEKNLKLTGGAIAAEPLYLLFEKYGHTTAHEKAKQLAHKALAEHSTLAEIVKDDTEGSEYWSKFTATEKNIIESPEKHYSGKAAQKTEIIIKNWENYLSL